MSCLLLGGGASDLPGVTVCETAPQQDHPSILLLGNVPHFLTCLGDRTLLVQQDHPSRMSKCSRSNRLELVRQLYACSTGCCSSSQLAAVCQLCVQFGHG